MRSIEILKKQTQGLQRNPGNSCVNSRNFYHTAVLQLRKKSFEAHFQVAP